MLYPKANSARAILDLDGIWAFKLDVPGEEDTWMNHKLEEPDYIAVPASYNDQKEGLQYRDHFGFVYYQRSFEVPKTLKGERIILRFGSATHFAKVYLNGKPVCEHKGGFLPFEAEINDFLIDGENLLSVAVSNRIDYSTLPVGTENGANFFGGTNPDFESIRQLPPKEENVPNFDFFNYSGLHRPVLIYTTPRDSHIDDITITTALDGDTAIVTYKIEGTGDVASSVRILDETGDCVGSCEGDEGSVVVQDSKLWEPGHPYLYSLLATRGEDCYTEEFGIRTVTVKGTQFLINGKPFYFKGAAKHEDSALRGKGLDEVLNVKDIDLLHWMGANSIRTSHYPYSEEMLRLCDREGIVVIDETPAVGLSFGAGDKEGGWKKFKTASHHEDVLRDLISRDKNHPCVVMWSIANEPNTSDEPKAALNYFTPLIKLVHEIDPGKRPATIVVPNNDYTKDLVSKAVDVVCLNRYYGWYNLSGDLKRAAAAFANEMEYWKQQGKPVMMTEYGADTMPGLHMATPGMWSEEYQVEYYKAMNAVLDAEPFIVGEQVWNFADFATCQGINRVDGNKKGLFTRDRRPKMAAHYFKERWHAIPDFDYKKARDEQVG